MQQRLTVKKDVKYSLGPYNKSNKTEQWIRITEGCPHNCPYCYEPTEFKVFEIPEIIRNKVKIMDMNLLAKKEAFDIINELGRKRVSDKVIYYELICGIDYRFLTIDIAKALKAARFQNIRIAWDWYMKDQYKINDAISLLTKAGYKRKDLMVFMICNWKIPYEENCRKLDLLKVWNIMASDCWYDNQTSPNIIPVHWTDKQIKEFRCRCRKHNQLIVFGIDPEV
jgi:hypothetical protein